MSTSTSAPVVAPPSPEDVPEREPELTEGAAPGRRRGPTLGRRAMALGRGTLSTPGRMTVFAVIVLVAVLVAGVVSARIITDRQEHHETLLAEIEPVANASQTLYSSLTIADSAANTAFISGGIEPPSQRQRYLDAIARSASAIVAATQGLDRTDTQSAHQLALINDQLTTYTGLVETARANNRSGNPVASAYLAEASSLMQDTILPSAADLYDRQSSSVGDTEKQWSSPPWTAFGLLVVALLLLALFQRWMSAVTGRRINLGLAVASAFVVIALLWTMVSGLLMANSNSRGLSEGAAPMNELTRQRINAQKIRAQETLNLVRRTDPEGIAAARDAKLKEIRATLRGYLDIGEDSPGARIGLDQSGAVTRSVGALDAWDAAQRRADSAYLQGDYQGAIRISAGQDPGDSGFAFDRFDEAMQSSIEAARERLRGRIADARQTSTSAPDALISLSTLASMALIGGVAPRIREYL